MRLLPSRLAFSVLAAAVALASCSSGGSNSSGPSAFDPAKGAEALRKLGTVALDGQVKDAKDQTPVKGKVAYGDVTEVSEHFGFKAGNTLVALEYRSNGKTAWMNRAPAEGVKELSILPDLLVVRAKDKPPWNEFSPAVFSAVFVTLPFDPAGLLNALAKDKIKFPKIDDADLQANETATFSAKIPLPTASRTGVLQVTVITDSKGVPVRLKITTVDHAKANYLVGASSKKLVVVAPPEDEIDIQNTPLPTAAGPFVEVASGTVDTVSYKVLRAPATDGGTCWKVQETPPYVTLYTLGGDGGYCIAPVGDPNGDWDLVGFPIDAIPPTPYEMIGFVVPPGSLAYMMMLDGTNQLIPIDATGFALYVGPLNPVAALANITLPDGRGLYCAPGLIMTPEDIRDAARTISSEPWNCLFAADV